MTAQAPHLWPIYASWVRFGPAKANL